MIRFESQLLPRNDGSSFNSIIADGLLNAQKFIWITSAITRDFRIYSKVRGKAVPFSEVIRTIRNQGVDINFLVSVERKDWLGKRNALYLKLMNQQGIEFRFCSRIHMKVIIVDGKWLYLGSANITSAGLGADTRKGKNNFEVGIVSSDRVAILELAQLFKEIWTGEHCQGCYRKKQGQCPGIQSLTDADRPFI
ncbi:MAG: hypothetical protein GF308_10385 [Candidatus Heimdallarchaeota archaeon]|nr:hypothetical protein [Candidatus Heimdallarchaeota archaeon]